MKNELRALITAGMGERSLNVFAKEAGVDAGNLSRILRGQRPSAAVLKKIGDAAFGVSTEELLFAAGYSDNLPGAHIPVYGTVSGGLPVNAFEEVLGHVPMPETLKGSTEEYFALRVRGNSMDAAHIPDGCTVIVRRQQTIRDGDIGVFLVGEDATVKKFRRSGEHILLCPQSTDVSHEVQIYGKSDCVSVLGAVVMSMVDIPCRG